MAAISRVVEGVVTTFRSAKQWWRPEDSRMVCVARAAYVGTVQAAGGVVGGAVLGGTIAYCAKTFSLIYPLVAAPAIASGLVGMTLANINFNYGHGPCSLIKGLTVLGGSIAVGAKVTHTLFKACCLVNALGFPQMLFLTAGATSMGAIVTFVIPLCVRNSNTPTTSEINHILQADPDQVVIALTAQPSYTESVSKIGFVAEENARG